MSTALRLFLGDDQPAPTPKPPQAAAHAPVAEAEIVLDVIVGNDESSRLLVVKTSDAAEAKLAVRQQSFAAGIGWFTQSSVEIEAAQAAALWPTLKIAATKPAAAAVGPAANGALRVVG